MTTSASCTGDPDDPEPGGPRGRGPGPGHGGLRRPREVRGDAAAERDGAADGSTCLADARPVNALPDGYPTDFPMPDGTVVFHVEDRGADGVVATGITDTPFRAVLGALNGPAQQAGFEVADGETEDHDAEANWTGNGYIGRWAIRESATCPGQTLIQLLSKRA